MSKTMLASVIVLTTLLVGCASNSTESGAASDEDCFYIRQVDGWSAIDDHHVFIEASRNENFLLTMDFPCRGIRHANVIALSNAMGRVCPNDFGRITYRDAGMRSSCRIGNVEKMSGKEEAEALVASRKEEE